MSISLLIYIIYLASVLAYARTRYKKTYWKTSKHDENFS